jgi:hypothetical protein
VAWSGVGLNLATNEPAQEALRAAVRTVLDRPAYRLRASQMAGEFARIDTRSEILSIISEVVAHHKAGLRAGTVAISQPRRTAHQRWSDRSRTEGGEVTLPSFREISETQDQCLTRTMAMFDAQIAVALFAAFLLGIVAGSGMEIIVSGGRH